MGDKGDVFVAVMEGRYGKMIIKEGKGYGLETGK